MQNGSLLLFLGELYKLYNVVTDTRDIIQLCKFNAFLAKTICQFFQSVFYQEQAVFLRLTVWSSQIVQPAFKIQLVIQTPPRLMVQLLLSTNPKNLTSYSSSRVEHLNLFVGHHSGPHWHGRRCMLPQWARAATGLTLEHVDSFPFAACPDLAPVGDLSWSRVLAFLDTEARETEQWREVYVFLATLGHYLQIFSLE